LNEDGKEKKGEKTQKKPRKVTHLASACYPWFPKTFRTTLKVEKIACPKHRKKKP
jgi:hypothetical protein